MLDGACQATAMVVCDDENPCTTDIGPTSGCDVIDNALPCDDGDVCTLGDQCVLRLRLGHNSAGLRRSERLHRRRL